MTTVHDVELAFDNFMRTAQACTGRLRDEAGSMDSAPAAGARTSLALGDDEITKLASIVLRLKDGKNELRRIWLETVRERNSFTPIGRLPVELLQLVFEHHDALSTHMEDHTVAHPAFLISAVCSHWRAVALHYPVLWTRINVLGETSRRLDYLSGQAKDLPLSLSNLPSGDDFTTPFLGRALAEEHLWEFVEEELPRTRELTLRLSPLLEYRPFFSGTSAPALERCTLIQHRSENFRLPVSILAPFLVNQSTVRLHHLQLDGVETALSPGLLKQNLTPLFSLTANCFSLNITAGTLS